MRTMKTLFVLVIFVLVVPGASAEEENSILFPQQVQPKISIRKQCQLNDEWKRYGSLKNCIEDKRHEELVELQKNNMRRQAKISNQAAQERRAIRDENVRRWQWEETKDALDLLSK
jgi:hypothetical protein